MMELYFVVAVILCNLDRTELKRFIDMLCQIRTNDGNPMTRREDGVYTLGYPHYPEVEN